MLYKGDKGVYDAAHPPEDSPAEPGAFRPQVCHEAIDRPARMPDSLLKNLYTKHKLVKRPRCKEMSPLCLEVLRYS